MFAPKVQTLRKFELIDAGTFFLLIGTDKLTKIANIIKLRRLPDTPRRQPIALRDVIEPG